ncbi:MAG: hypothetical protein PVH19_12495, partial [Planctomycetia bacterium]
GIKGEIRKRFLQKTLPCLPEAWYALASTDRPRGDYSFCYFLLYFIAKSDRPAYKWLVSSISVKIASIQSKIGLVSRPNFGLGKKMVCHRPCVSGKSPVFQTSDQRERVHSLVRSAPIKKFENLIQYF